MTRALYERDFSFDYSKRNGDHFDSISIPWAKRGTHFHIWLRHQISQGVKYQTKKRFELLVGLNGLKIEKLTYDYLPE